MKRLATLSLFVIGILLGMAGAQMRSADAREANAPSKIAVVSPDSSPLPVVPPNAEMRGKKCGFDSDCPFGKCSGGNCGACGFDSDCKGWGKCKGSACGACNFDSDCKDFGGCSNGHCNKSPY